MMFLKLVKKIANLERRGREHSKKTIGSKELRESTNIEDKDEKKSPQSRSARRAQKKEITIPTLDLHSIISGKVDERKKRLLQRATITGVLFLLLLGVKEFRTAAFLLALMVIAAVSKLIQEPIPFVVGLDLCLFVTTVVGCAIHPFAGFIIGGTASIIGSFLRQTEAVENIVVPVLGYFWSSLAVWILHAHASLWQAGVITTMLYTIHNVIVFGYLRHFSIHSITFIATSVPFNLFLISRFGEKLAYLLM